MCVCVCECVCVFVLIDTLHRSHPVVRALIIRHCTYLMIIHHTMYLRHVRSNFYLMYLLENLFHIFCSNLYPVRTIRTCFTGTGNENNYYHYRPFLQSTIIRNKGRESVENQNLKLFFSNFFSSPDDLLLFVSSEFYFVLFIFRLQYYFTFFLFCFIYFLSLIIFCYL